MGLLPLGNPRRVDWTASDGANGGGDGGSRLEVFRDLQHDSARRAGTNLYI